MFEDLIYNLKKGIDKIKIFKIKCRKIIRINIVCFLIVIK